MTREEWEAERQRARRGGLLTRLVWGLNLMMERLLYAAYRRQDRARRRFEEAARQRRS